MNSAFTPDRHSASAERVVSSSYLVGECLLTPPPQPSFAAAVSFVSTVAWLLVFVIRLITSEVGLTISSLRKPNYVGAVNYLRTIIENGKIIQELPEEER